MKIRQFTIAGALVASLAVAGCATEAEQRAGTGAVLGAGAGALAGQAIGQNTESTLIGAAGGAILGAVVGQATTPRRGEELCRYQRRDGSIYTAPCDERYYSGQY